MTTAPVHLKRLLFGRPLATHRLEHERLDKKSALAVLSSDAISSVAYATEQTLLALAILGTAALHFVVPISAVIVGLLLLVALSYRQTIFAYPNGGGSYTVAKENLGVTAGLTAAASLLTDYILTVAVSISGGIAAITSAFPALGVHTVLLCNIAIAMLMLMNLRGVRESGVALSVPTYVFIVLMILMIGAGLSQALTGAETLSAKVAAASRGSAPSMASPAGFALLFLVMRGFAEGCVAMTGTEAISNGIGVFRKPSARNAAITLGWMAAILAVFFIGTSVLAQRFSIMPTATETVLSQLNRRVFGSGALYYALQYATFAVLVLAANTAFADFPRLASILARDGYMPRQFTARGDRLAFSNGIIVLAVVSMALVTLFLGNTSALIPLYAIGVFICFSLSQAGMVRHWLDTRENGRRLLGWRWRATLNGVGAAATMVVALVQVATKFTHGAWIVVLIIPAIMWLLAAIHRHYQHFSRDVEFTGQAPMMFLHHTVLVPVNAITKPAAAALVYATAIASDVRAVYIEIDAAISARMREGWEAWDIGVDLTVLPSPFRSVVRPLVEHIDSIRASGATDLVTVVVPETVPHRWWQGLLHNRTAWYIRMALLSRPNVVVTSVRFRPGAAPEAAA
jgi:amino acid transporter